MKNTSQAMYWRNFLAPIIFTYTIGISVYCQYAVSVLARSQLILHILMSFYIDLFLAEFPCWLWNRFHVIRPIVHHVYCRCSLCEESKYLILFFLS